MEKGTTPVYPRGLRNNNPGNIRKGGDVFQGEIVPSGDTAFKQFKTMAYGYRAMFVTLDTYRKRGMNTIDSVIKRWAPPSENNTETYIKKVADWSGVPRNKILSETSGSDYIQIVAAMSRMENGREADMAEVKSGFLMQDRLK